MIHESLKEYLKNKKILDKDFARKLGVSPGYISMLRRGQKRPSAKLARKIETMTGIPRLRLLYPDENSKVRNFIQK